MGRDEKETDRRRRQHVGWSSTISLTRAMHAALRVSSQGRYHHNMVGLSLHFLHHLGIFKVRGGPFPCFCMMINLKQPPPQRRSFSLPRRVTSRATPTLAGFPRSDLSDGSVGLRRRRDFRIDNFYFAAGGRERGTRERR